MSETGVDFSRSSVARYIQLATLFRRRIEAGDWANGSQIPTVDDLAAECAVARATVRQALDILAGEGLIQRFRAKGTFVTARPLESTWCDVGADISGQLRARPGAEIEMVLEERDTQPTRVFHPLGTPAAAYRHLIRRHWRDGKPFLLSNFYVDEALCAKLSRKDIETKPALGMVTEALSRKFGDARQTLTIGTADMSTAKALDLPLNAPVAIVDRVVVDEAGVRVFVACGIYRGDVVRLDITLR